VLRLSAGEESPLSQAIGTAELDYGDVVTCLMAGGGGYGDPLARDPQAVLEDVRAGLVSVESARTQYGVVIDPDSRELDAEATRALRQQLEGQPP
jgi:N-methylhydantoinase B